MNEFLANDISSITDYLDKAIQIMEQYGEKTREQDIAKQKLEEAVFWLTYGLEEENENI